MRVLVACEFSGIVRDAFLAHGNDAWSCDMLPTERHGPHIQGDVLNVLDDGWDIMIAHPPCTRLSNSGVKHLYYGMRKENGIDPEKWEEMQKAADFYLKLLNAPIPHKAVENPVMHPHAQKLVGGKAHQYVQPWWFGEKKNKATGFRLINLPKLVKTDCVGPMPKNVTQAERRSWNEVWFASPGPDRWKDRSRTYPGIAKALAAQISNYMGAIKPTQPGKE